MDILNQLYKMTALQSIFGDPSSLLMLSIGALLFYLGIKKQYEPLLLIPIAFGVVLANLPGGGMGIVSAEMVHKPDGSYMNLLEIATEFGIMNYLYYALIKTGLLPPLI